jgi:Xaa-Pro aminopeptidase
MIYDLVLRAQQAVIRKVKPGLLWSELHTTAVEVITAGLIDLGILEGPIEKAIEDKAFRPFFMHGTGHWLGMDVHDVGDYKVGDEWRQLEAGMVTTVEPGIYITDSRKVPARWRNIGIRIEDDVAVGRHGPDVLSRGLVKEPDAIEKLMAG